MNFVEFPFVVEDVRLKFLNQHGRQLRLYVMGGYLLTQGVVMCMYVWHRPGGKI